MTQGERKSCTSRSFSRRSINLWDGGILPSLLTKSAMPLIGFAAFLMRVFRTPELRADAWAGCAFAKMSLNGYSCGRSYDIIEVSVSFSSRLGHALPFCDSAYTQCGGDGASLTNRPYNSV